MATETKRVIPISLDDAFVTKECEAVSTLDTSFLNSLEVLHLSCEPGTPARS